jgi:hypothetical protein
MPCGSPVPCNRVTARDPGERSRAWHRNRGKVTALGEALSTVSPKARIRRKASRAGRRTPGSPRGPRRRQPVQALAQPLEGQLIGTGQAPGDNTLDQRQCPALGQRDHQILAAVELAQRAAQPIACHLAPSGTWDTALRVRLVIASSAFHKPETPLVERPQPSPISRSCAAIWSRTSYCWRSRWSYPNRIPAPVNSTSARVVARSFFARSCVVPSSTGSGSPRRPRRVVWRRRARGLIGRPRRPPVFLRAT